MPGPESHANVNQAATAPLLRLRFGENVGNYEDELNALATILSLASLDPEKLLYRGISQSRLPIVQRYGTDLPRYQTLFAQSWAALSASSFFSDLSVFEYAYGHRDPMIVTYHAHMFKPGVQLDGTVEIFEIEMDPLNESFVFLSHPKEALAAIVLLEN